MFPNFCHLSSIHSFLLSPFSCSISVSFCSAFPTPGPFFQFLTISSSSCTLSLYTVPSPLFQIWPAPLLPLPAPISQLLVPFSQFIFPSSFHFPCLSVPSGPLLIYFPVSSLICPAHVLSFMQFMPPFLCSYLLCPLPIRITPFSQFLFPNSLVLPSSSSVCSVSSFFVLNVTMLFCLLGWNRLRAVGLFS